MIKQIEGNIKIDVPEPLNIRRLLNGQYEIYFEEAF